MIHLSKVTKLSSGKTALRDATLLLPTGSYAVLKVDSDLTGTVLFRLIMGYERPDRGQVRINDINVTNISPPRIPFLRRSIGVVEYKPILAGSRTVRENLAMPLQIAGFDQKAMQERIADKLEEANLDDVANIPVMQLNASKHRLLACARATIHNPQLLLADSPDAEPNSACCDLMFRMLEAANTNGATVLVLTSNSPPARGFTHSLQTYKGTFIENDIAACGLATS